MTGDSKIGRATHGLRRAARRCRVGSVRIGLFLLLLSMFGVAHSAIELDSVSDYQTPGTAVEYWVEKTPGTDVDTVLSLPSSAWKTSDSDHLNFGYTPSVYWFRLSVRSGFDETKRRLLEIAYPVLDHIHVFAIRDGGVDDVWRLGDKRPFHERPIVHRNFVVPLSIRPRETLTVLLRVETTSALQVPMALWSPDAFHAAEQPRVFAEGVYYGVVIVMILYNLFVFFAVGERSFLYYVGFIFAMPMFIASLHGFAFQFLWPRATWWNDQAIVFFLNLTILFGGIFAMRFLTVIPLTHPILSRITGTGIVMSALFCVSTVIVPYSVLIWPTIALGVAGCLWLLGLCAIRLRRGDHAARYYLVAWASMFLGGIVLALNKFQVLPQTFFTENAVQIGSGLGVILLSIALADRLNRDKKAVLESQQRLFDEERKARLAQAESLDAQRQANATLEERVAQRTRELEDLNARLRELNATDPLTGIKNRGYFDEAFRLAGVRAYRFGENLSLMVVDIDYFKRFNDTYGHQVGDDCLRMVAGCIRRRVIRPQDLAARYGGEEFVVLLPDTTIDDAVRMAERIRQDIESTDFRIADQVTRLTVSIGVCCKTPENPDAMPSIFRAADTALYHAKGEGRNRVRVYDAEEMGAP